MEPAGIGGECFPEYADSNISYLVLSWMGERCPSPSIMYPTVVIYGLILLLGLVGNICTCIVIIVNKNMHNPTNYYLLSLALSDILILILGLPMELYIVTDYNYPYRFGEAICQARAFLVEFTSYASILVICLFSFERWIAICFPLRAQLFLGTRRTLSLICGCWVVSCLCSLPVVFVVRINKLPLPDFAVNQTWTHLVSADGKTIDRTEFCAMDIDNLEDQKEIIYLSFIGFFLLPAIIITVMYGHIAIRLHLSESQLGREKKGRSHKWSVLRVLVSVVITFFVFWLPFHMQRLLSIFLNERQGDASAAVQTLFTLVFYISGYCYYSNSACNPILYNIFSEKFRAAFCRTILGERLTGKFFPGLKNSRTFAMQSCRVNSSPAFMTTRRAVSAKMAPMSRMQVARREEPSTSALSSRRCSLRRSSSQPEISSRKSSSNEAQKLVPVHGLI